MRDTLKTVWVSAVTAGVVAGILSLGGLILAGDLEPPAPPAPTMKTLDEVQPTWSQNLVANDGDEEGCHSSRFDCIYNSPYNYCGGAGIKAVYDKETGLVWQKHPDSEYYTWAECADNCRKEVCGRRVGWRIPTSTEIGSLGFVGDGCEMRCGHPFENVMNSFYWSGTTSVTNETEAYVMGFGDDLITTRDKNANTYCFCVRGGNGYDAY